MPALQKSNSSTSWGTLHFTRQPRSYEVAPDLRQFHFQTLISNTSDSSSSLFRSDSQMFFKSSGSKWYEGQPAKSVFLLTSTINQPRFNKSMLHRPPSHLLKRLRCWSQRKVQATWASEISWSCVSCWDLHDGLPILSIIKHKTSERHICPKPWKVEVFQ